MIRTARLKLCNCRFSSYTHLRTYYQYVPLEYGNAVAISYAWGDFDQRDVSIGHDEYGKEVKLCLGHEWPVDDVVQGLARICREHSRGRGCWMDQLCIERGNPKAKRNILMQIPTIYRTLRTLIMLPGSPCRCFRALAAISFTLDIASPELDCIPSNLLTGDLNRTCCEPYGVSSYFHRLWTMQELQYSSEIMVVWCSRVARRCVPTGSDLTTLPIYAQQILQRSKSHEIGMDTLNIKSYEFLCNCIESIAQWTRRIAEDEDQPNSDEES